MSQGAGCTDEPLVFFCSEASNGDYYGTAHGAYLSGLRAAQEILALYA